LTAPTYTPDLTQVPTRTIPQPMPDGNIGIGPTKVNRVETSDFAGELDAAEENYLRDMAQYLMRYVGPLGDSESKDALPASTLSLRSAILRLGNANPSLYRWHDHFEMRNDAILTDGLDPRWLISSGAWTPGAGLCGIVQCSQNTGTPNILRFHAYEFERVHQPLIEAIFSWDEIDADTPVVRVGYVDATGNTGFGVEFNKGASNFFRAYVLNGGAYTYTATTVAPDNGTLNRIRVGTVGVGGSQSIQATVAKAADWDTAASVVVASPSLASANLTPVVNHGSGSHVGKVFDLDYIGLEADFGAVTPLA
jgi:hypothetical protein